jgi:hypothetical protein
MSVATAVSNIEQSFRDRINDAIALVPTDHQKYRVSTPFQFDDGDNLVIILKRENNQWLLSDEGHTYFHLTYEIDESDLRKEPRHSIIANTLTAFQIEDRGGELILRLQEDSYGAALYSFIQALLKIVDVQYLSREKVRTTFKADFQIFLEKKVPAPHRTFQWYDPEHDPKKNYPVDCRINGSATPLFIIALKNDTQNLVATITLHQFEKWGVEFEGIGIFEDQLSISGKVLAKFSDICDRQYPSLGSAQKRFPRLLAKHLNKP